jgi:hypothetical protein
MSSNFIHLTNGSFLFKRLNSVPLCVCKYMCLCVYIIFSLCIHSLIGMYIEMLQQTLELQIPLSYCFYFLGHVSRIGIVGLYGSSFCNVLRKLIILLNIYTNLNSYKHYTKVPFPPSPHQSLLSCAYFDNSPSGMSEVISHGFIYTSLMTSIFPHTYWLFVCLLLNNGYLGLLPNFKPGFLFSC